MTGYTKLFSTILQSTIWREPNEVRIVWITMLAMTDKSGEVQSSIPGLAHMACVTVDQCEEALKVLSSPDKYSRTKDHEGRRIEEVDGGWILLNHPKYRAMMSLDERREYFRIKKSEQRDRASVKDLSNNVKDSQRQSNDVLDIPQCPHIAEADSEADPKAIRGESSRENEELLAEWHSYEALPKVRSVSSDRRIKMKARLKDPFFRENHKAAISIIASSDFCAGKNDRGWKADFDFLLKPDTVIKAIEGKYDNKRSSSGSQQLRATLQDVPGSDEDSIADFKNRFPGSRQ